ncbi:hypothetical protein U7230_06175 [Carboxydochorda subterranea]|uniref:Uncharacterized protein n=1 Tax=Carboxydichorda subterranea TaxID=3109565 RepID=A0ABZ1C1C4_9FIRM|nr:hypothetical protein [Limnochorda sp. L945t]WRP18586.1 hypothetical protein U7230_06175 [Limnochorda sp. L945t]
MSAALFRWLRPMEKNKRWQWPVVALAFVVGLSGMAFGQRWFDRYQQAPVLDQLRSTEGVERAWIAPDGGARALWVRLQPVDDLPGTVDAIRRAAASGRLGRVDEIVLVDGRTPALSAASRELSLALHEGASTGAFTEMAQRVRARARELGIEVGGIFADGTSVYVMLQSPDGGYLYEVVPRPQNPAPGPGTLASLPVRVVGMEAVQELAAGGPPRGGEAR